MSPADFKPFCALLDATYDLIGVGPAKIISAGAKTLFFKDLERYDLIDIEHALSAHRLDPVNGRFTPKPADIAGQIEARRPVQWIPADEAWARVPKVEGAPGLLNQVTSVALAAASGDLAAGDVTAARMAFKACYNRLVDMAKLHGAVPEYFLSPGGSYQEQQDVLTEGARLGLIKQGMVTQIGHDAPNTAGVARVQRMMASIEWVTKRGEIAP